MRNLLTAACDGDLATIKRLHAEGVDLTKCNEDGTTAIMLATIHGQTATVKFLQTAGASIIEKNIGGFSAMMFAAWNDRWALVQYFIQECGASISDATSYGETLWDRLRLQNADPVEVSLLKIMHHHGQLSEVRKGL
jgi:ankyrin repeat protein